MDSPADKVLTYAIHDVTPYINWIYFFHAWGFQPRFAAIANIHGCDSCRASWLAAFAVEERAKAAEAMQLFKEANRMLNQLDKDYHIHIIFRLCKANADGDIYCWTAHAFLYSANRSPIRMAVLFSASAILCVLFLPAYPIR